jgi:hypothetical protein
MVEVAKGRMDKFDWAVLGHELHDKAGRPALPTRRLDIPLPETPSGLYEIAHKLGFLAQEMSRIARLSDDARTVIVHTDSLLRQSRQQFVRLRAEMETIMREREAQEERPENSSEHLRVIR